MPQESNADDQATAEQPAAVVGEEQNTLFSWASDQPIAEEGQQQPEPAEEGEQPASEEAEAQGKDSGPEASPEPAEEPEVESAAEEEAPEEELSDSEKKRFEYWQSKHDQVKNELEEYRQRYGDTPEEVVKLAQNIVRNPELLDAVEGALQNGDAQAARAPSDSQEQAKGELQRPTKPQKPAGYDHYEALNDPESESFKYLEARQQYEEDLQDYLVKKEERREQELAAQQQRAQQQQKQRQARQQMAQSLKNGYGMNQQEVEEFFKVVSDKPELDDLVTYYRAKTGKTKQASEAEKRKQELQARKNRNTSSPPPAGAGASASKPPGTGEPNGPFVWQ